MSIEELSEAAGLTGADRDLLALLLAEEGVELGASTAIPRRDATEAPLSWSQERLWVLDRMTPGTSSLDMPVSVRLRGALDRGVLARSFGEIVRRHESLRTRFELRGGAPVQVIDPPPVRPWPLPLADLGALAAEPRSREEARLAAAETHRSFDLARGPLLSTVLLRSGEGEHALLLNVHHIVSDGWSLGVLIREMSALYAALATGLEPTAAGLAEPAIQYADFAAWQRERQEGEELAEQLAYWRGQLSGVPPLELPVDRPRPALQTFRGASEIAVLPPALAQAIRELARAEAASPFMVLLAAFSLVLGRLAGSEDFAVGSPIAGRSRPELEGLIGFFLNSLALRADLSGDPSFRALAGRAREAALGAYAHQEVPFEKLLAELDVERDLSRTPIFQVFLNMLNLPRAEARFVGLTLEVISVPEVESKFDLTIYAAEVPEGLSLNLVYNADLYSAGRMRELLAQLEGALTQGLAAPDRPISQISLATARSAALLPDPAAPLDDAFAGSIVECFRVQAARRPGHPAVIDRRGTWTYADLAAAADRIAARLAAAGIERGDRVAVWAHRSAPIVPAVLGSLAAGGAFAMLDPAYPGERIVAMLDLAEPRGFVRLEAAGTLPAEVEAWLARLPAGARIDLPAGGAAEVLGALAASPEDPPSPPEIEIGPDDLALVAFTSGSTGAPKGIAGRHGPLTHFLPWQCAELGFSEDDVFTLLSGLAHDPLQRDLFTPLWLGATIAVPDFEDVATPGRLAAWMAESGATVAHLTPAMGQLIAESAEIAAAAGRAVEVPALRRALLVGDALTRLDVARLARLAPNLLCVNLYGSTETQRAVGYHLVTEAAGALDGGALAGSAAREVLPLGRGMRDVQLLVLDRAGRVAGLGEVGELAVRSPHLAAGYLGDPELTRARFVPAPGAVAPGDRMYLTGDLGRYLLDGEVEFVARADAQVKIRGFRIEPGEIEAGLARHPGVREAVVVARSDSTGVTGAAGEKRLVAYYVPAPGAEVPAAEELSEFLRVRLPEYMVPALWVALERLPVTPNGKVDRKALPAPRASAAASAAYVPPQGESERAIAEIWREALGLERVGRHDKFFQLGGHSLLLVRMHARLAERFGGDLAVIDLFRHPDVASLARFLDGRGAALGSGVSVETLEVEARAGRIEAGKDRRKLRLERLQGAGGRGEGEAR